MTNLTNLRRPKLLIRAARLGLTSYHRSQYLKRIFGDDAPKNQTQLLRILIAREHELEHTRKTRCATYSPRRHVEILITILSEKPVT